MFDFNGHEFFKRAFAFSNELFAFNCHAQIKKINSFVNFSQFNEPKMSFLEDLKAFIQNQISKNN